MDESFIETASITSYWQFLKLVRFIKFYWTHRHICTL